MASIFNGTWVSEDKDLSNIDGYLSKIGLGLIKRKIGKNLTRTITFTDNGDGTVTIRNKTSIRDSTDTVTLGQPVEAEVEDGRQCKVTVKFENGKLYLSEEWSGPTSYHVWTLENDMLVVSLECDGKRARLTYKRQ